MPNLNRRLSSILIAMGVLAGCGNRDKPANSPNPVAARPATSTHDAQTDALAVSVPETDDEADVTVVENTVVDAGPTFTPPTEVVALGAWVPVRKEPTRESAALGYLRSGAVVKVTGMPAGKATCPVRRDHVEGGWYKLQTGGYICVGGALAVPWPSSNTRPSQPVLDAGMPYTYAIVYGNTPMFRGIPSQKDMAVARAMFASDAGPIDPPSTPAPSANQPTSSGGSNDSSNGSSGSTDGNSGGTESTPSADADGGTPVQASAPAPRPRPRPRPVQPVVPTRALTPEERRRMDPHCDPMHHRCLPPSTTTSRTTSSSSRTTTITPRVLSGRPRLSELRGEGPVIRRLLVGMYIALDRVVRDRESGAQYWRTQSGGYVATGPLGHLHGVSTYHGVVLEEGHTLPYAIMANPDGWLYKMNSTKTAVSFSKQIPRYTAVELESAEPVVIGTQTYYAAKDGFAVNANSARLAAPRTPPDGVAADERWIDVDLDQQTLVAYEGAKPVFATLVSTGRGGGHNPLRNYLTPAGSFRIRSKHVTATMDGDTAADGPYSIEDVPWAMYFRDSYAVHGAFWHNQFGYRMSHGCVNLSPEDARWVFLWARPELPEGWHIVFANDEHPGSRVEVRHSAGRRHK